MSLFGSSNAKSPPPGIGSLSLQQSSYSTPIVIVYGTNRVTGNLVWYDAFTQTLVSTGGGGGKGGVVGGGGKGGGSSEYNYSASFAIGICEGQITGVGQCWVSKQITTIPTLGGAVFTGALDQSPWGYLTTNFPAAADGYNTLAYAGFPNFQLGTSAETPQFSFEVSGLKVIGAGNQDAAPDQVVIDFLTRSQFPPSFIDTYTAFASYCTAMGFFISPILDQQRQAFDWLNEWMATLNSEFVFTNGVLTIVPRGDVTVTGNGVTYTPNLTPIYNIGDDDYVITGDEDPVTITRPDLQDAYNQMPIEYCSRDDQYNLQTFVAEDAAHIDMFGIRTAPTLQAHHITDPTIAQNMAYIALWRQLYIDHGPQYEFKLPWNFILLDPMDLITINDTNLGLINKLVRAKSIKEDEDGQLSFTCEDMPGDLGGISLYNMVTPNKYTANYAATPPSINPPVFFETPLQLVQKAAVEIGIGISGAGPTWGGCFVWVSTDDLTYQYLTQVNGANRMGVLTAVLATFAAAPGGNNIDTTHTLAIDMTESGGTFQNSATDADAVAFNSLCFVDGEFLAFGNDALTAANKYNLTYLNRGAYGSPISAHAIGSNFVRVDQSVTRYDVDQTRIGTTVYFKFLSFNQWGGGQQTLDEVPAYSYVIQGTALYTNLANPTNLAVSYTDNIAILGWSPVSDIRSPIFYQIRKGAAFASAQVVGETVQTSYPVFGTDTYWITAVYATPTGAQVYSANPISIAITTPSLAQFLIEEWDEASTGWSGTLSGGAYLSGGNVQVDGTGNILADLDFLNTPNILAYAAGAGTYTIPAGHQIASNYIINAKVIINWTIDAVNLAASDVTAFADVPTVADVTGGVSSALVTSQPQINLSLDAGSTWLGWQNWVPGVYTFNKIQSRMIIQVLALGITAVMTDMSMDVDVPLRTDTGTSTSDPSVDTTINFPGGEYNVIPVVMTSILNLQAGDAVIISSTPNETNFAYSVWNAGSRVVRTINWTATGY